jgi:hypothetical protein
MNFNQANELMEKRKAVESIVSKTIYKKVMEFY